MHGGDIYSFFLEHKTWGLDFSCNVNTTGLPCAVKDDIKNFLNGNLVSSYPDSDCNKVKELIAKTLNINCLKEDNIIVGAGVTSLIYDLSKVLAPKTCAVITPAFSEYRKALLQAGTEEKNILSFSSFPSFDMAVFQKEIAKKKVSALFLATPANPTGSIFYFGTLQKIITFCKKNNCTVILDCSFVEYSKKAMKVLDEILSFGHKNLVVLRGFTKFYGLASLRIGYCIVFDSVLTAKMKEKRQSWAVNAVAQVAASSILENFCKLSSYYEDYSRQISKERKRLKTQLEKLGLQVFPSQANYILFKSKSLFLKKQMEEKGILIRQCDDFEGLDGSFYRVAVRKKEDDEKLLAALSSLLHERLHERPQKTLHKKTSPHRAKCIMVCGTASNVGKSLLCAALCRIFLQDGYRTAPFKSQNMALNSGVVSNGLEIGRAQIVQAECCKKDAVQQMNPILLKCDSDTQTQVIVNGKVKKNMTARQYFSYKKKLLPVVLKDFEELAKDNDIIVIEGAGSIAEINLWENDIVNMGLAKILHCPVILLGDIDKGGVFASLFGSVSLLPKEEKELVKGFVINKFRGDKELLKSGLLKIFELTKKEVLAVVPYMNVDIEKEDSLCLEKYKTTAIDKEKIVVCILSFPHISNFTDFERLLTLQKCQVFFVKTKEEYQDLSKECQKAGSKIDLFILPGSKNTVQDFEYMKKEGFTEELKEYAKKGIILGICAGLQMLGAGYLDLLPCSTTFSKTKKLSKLKGKVPFFQGFWSCLQGKKYFGYEIHTGRTKGLHKSFSGLAKEGILGTYIHGFLDDSDILCTLLNALLERKGLPSFFQDASLPPYKDYREKQYDILANTVRSCFDMKKIYQIIFQSEENAR